MSLSVPNRIPATAVLPPRDGDPPSAAPFRISESASTSEILRCAETLAIPWKRILLGEIEAEQKLRRHLADIEAGCPLSPALTILSFSLLQSWRVRDQIENLACQARGASIRGAVKQLRTVFRRLCGKDDRDQVALAQHFWFAYQRVLLLQRVCRAAAKSRGSLSERLAFVCSTTRCCFDDSAWAVCQEDAPTRRNRLEEVVRKVREEGFLIPRASTENRSFAELRRIALASPNASRRRGSRLRSRDLLSAPQRVRLPLNAV